MAATFLFLDTVALLSEAGNDLGYQSMQFPAMKEFWTKTKSNCTLSCGKKRSVCPSLKDKSNHLDKVK
jgi:hypothetical protein